MKRTFDNRKNSGSNNGSDSDSEDFIDNNIVINSTKKQRIEYDKYKEKYNIISSEMLSREITMEHIFDLDLNIDDQLWFMEQFKILKNIQKNTEDYFRIKNIIYNHYMNLKSIDIKKLENIKHESNDEHDIISKILNSEHSDVVKVILYKKYKRCIDHGSGLGSSDEYLKTIEWIETVLDLPTHVKNENNNTVQEKLTKLWKSLNENISGLVEIKEKIMESIVGKLLNPESKGNVLLFIGPPGVGKTIISTSISQALNMPFDQISFGSVKDSSMLIGHSQTYISSTPGLFTKILLKSKRLDTVVLLDEIDKIPDTPEGRSISSVLLHVLDKTQNHRFRDMYISEYELDLSKIIFLCAANSIDTIDPIVLDRMTIVQFPTYTIETKMEIVNNHILPRIRKELKFTDHEITLDNKELEYLIKNKTEEQPGMRSIEKKIYELYERLALLKHSKGLNFSFKINIKFPCKIDKHIIDILL